jgi:hypothetical protein
LKRVLIIYWYKLTVICLLALLLLVLTIGEINYQQRSIKTGISLHTPYQTYFEPAKPERGSLEEIYQDVFMTMLSPYIDKAIDDYYEKHTGYTPGVDPWQPQILYIKRPNGYRTFLFEMKLEVAPYLGAHNSIGVDHITLSVSPGEVKVLEFEHIKDYPIPPWLQPLE